MAFAATIEGRDVHDLPADLEAALVGSPRALPTWHDITPLARNEWICWVISPKKAETRTTIKTRTLARQKAEGWHASPPLGLNLRSFGQRQSIFDLDAKVADCCLDLGVTEQDLHGSEISSLLVDQSRLRPAERMSAIFLFSKPDCCHPLVYKAGVLANAQVREAIGSAGKDILI
jgi:hypothetical protein